MSWAHLDNQMAHHKEALMSHVGLTDEQCLQLATSVSADIRFLSSEAKRDIVGATPVPLKERLAELKAFQGWMDEARKIRSPFVTRPQVITQNYFCFVYLSEACFSAVRKHAVSGSVAKKCCSYLTDNPVRAFRNAIAHSNWQYRSDFNGIVYWAKKGAEVDEPLHRFEVDSQKLDFWQSLSRCVAYSIYENLA